MPDHKEQAWNMASTIVNLARSGALDALDVLCLRSFMDAGHPVDLYAYGPVSNVPDGVRLCEAEDVLMLDDAYGVLQGYLIDLFRTFVLAQQPGAIWVDRYVYCLKPLVPEGGRLFGWERGDVVSTGVLALPSKGEALADLQRVMADPMGVPPHLRDDQKARLIAARDAGTPVHVRDMPWGCWGAPLLTHVLKETGEIVHALDRDVVTPVSYADRASLLEDGVALADVVSEDAVCVPLYGKSLKSDLARQGASAFEPTSVVGRLLADHGLSGHVMGPEKRRQTAATPVLPETATAVRPLDNMVAVSLVTNEAPYLLDWIAYHMGVGITHFLVYTHNCDDPSERMLDALASRGLVTRESLILDGDQKPERAALDAAYRHRVVTAADAVVVMDVDEYINVHVGEGRLNDLFQAADDPDMISLTWRLFGSSGRVGFEDQPVPEQFTQAAVRNCPEPPHAWGIRTIIRKEAGVGAFGVHRPHKLPMPAPYWVNGSGVPMPDRYFEGGWRSGKECWGYDFATMNHYATRSRDAFLVQLDGGRGGVKEDTAELWSRFDRNDEADASILSLWSSAKALRNAFAGDPILAPLHAQAVAWHKARAEVLNTSERQQALFETIATAPDVDPIVPPEAANAPSAAVAGFVMREDPPSIGPEAEAQFRDLMARTQAKQEFLKSLALPPRSDRVVVVSSMKNEGCFILEWLAYHMSIGVTHFLIYTNDCDDPTNAILDRLATIGLVTRRDNPFDADAGEKPQRKALNDAASQPEVVLADWVGVIDVDEFLNIHVGDGTFSALLEATGDPNVISMTWRMFGNGGVHAFEDRWQTEQFTRCAPLYLPKPRLGWGFKSFYRPDGPFEKLGVHRPLDLDPDGLDEVRWVNGAGRVMPDRVALKNEWFSRKDTLGYDMVTLNHYVLRSAESFLVKRQRGRINHVDQDQGVAYWMARNYATETDTSIQRHLPRAKTVLSRLLKDVTLMRLHEDAVAWHRDRIEMLRSEADYASLYDTITDPSLPDAIWRAQPPKDEEIVAAE